MKFKDVLDLIVSKNVNLSAFASLLNTNEINYLYNSKTISLDNFIGIFGHSDQFIHIQFWDVF